MKLRFSDVKRFISEDGSHVVDRRCLSSEFRWNVNRKRLPADTSGARWEKLYDAILVLL
jgi:hypothetical protein